MKKIILSLYVIISIVFHINVYAANKLDNMYTEDKLDIVVSSKHAEFILKLKSNPSTGYTWFLRTDDTYLIIPLKHHFEPANKKSIGEPGYEFWTFRVKPVGFVVPQHTSLRMIYARPWQSTDNSTQLVFNLFTQEK